MGLWGAAQAIAFAVGGFLGTVAVDISRLYLADLATAYGVVFAAEGTLFLIAAIVGTRVQSRARGVQPAAPSFGQIAMAEVFDAR